MFLALFAVISALHLVNAVDSKAEVLSRIIDGDMVVSPEQLAEIKAMKFRRTARINAKYRWHNNTIPFRIHDKHFCVIL